MKYFILLLLIFNLVNLVAATAAEQYIVFRKTLPEFKKHPMSKKVENQKVVSNEIKLFLTKQQKHINQIMGFINQLPDDHSIVPIKEELFNFVTILNAGKLLLYSGRILCEQKQFDRGILYYKNLHKWIGLIRKENVLISIMISIAIEKLLIKDLDRFYKAFSDQQRNDIVKWLSKRPKGDKLIIGAMRGERNQIKSMINTQHISKDILSKEMIAYLELHSGIKDIRKEIIIRFIDTEERRWNRFIKSYHERGLTGFKQEETRVIQRAEKILGSENIKLVFSSIFLIFAPTRGNVDQVINQIVSILEGISVFQFSPYIEEIKAVSNDYTQLLKKMK